MPDTLAEAQQSAFMSRSLSGEFSGNRPKCGAQGRYTSDQNAQAPLLGVSLEHHTSQTHRHRPIPVLLNVSQLTRAHAPPKLTAAQTSWVSARRAQHPHKYLREPSHSRNRAAVRSSETVRKTTRGFGVAKLHRQRHLYIILCRRGLFSRQLANAAGDGLNCLKGRDLFVGA